MIEFHWHDLALARILGSRFDSRLRNDVNSFYEVAPVPASPSRTPRTPYRNYTMTTACVNGTR